MKSRRRTSHQNCCCHGRDYNHPEYSISKTDSLNSNVYLQYCQLHGGSTMSGYRVMSCSSDSSSGLSPRCKYTWSEQNKAPPELYARHWLVEVTYEWISVLVYALSTSICALPSEGVEGVKGSAGACWCASRDGVKYRLGHLELFSWIYCVRGGRGRAAAPPPSCTRELC